MNPFVTHGAVSWSEYLAIDPARSLDFYSKISGWQYLTMPMQDGSTYHIAQQGGINVAGLMKRPQETIPACWGFYITVNDVKAFAAEHASKLFIPLTDTPMGPFCGLADPHGGMVYAMQYNPLPPGSETQGVTNFLSTFTTPGLFSWFELHTPDAVAAAAFYGDIFDWTFKEMEIPGGVYRQINVGCAAIGGIAQVEVERANWMGYITSSDVDRQTDLALSLGAKALMGPFDYEGVGRMTHILDPDGVLLALIQYENMFSE